MRIVYLSYLFVKEALHRIVGMDREASPFTVAVLVGSVLSLIVPVFRLFRPRRPPSPSLFSGMTGIALVRHAARRIGGPDIHETPFADAILVSSLLAPAIALITLPLHLVQAALNGVATVWRRYAPPRAASLAR